MLKRQTFNALKEDAQCTLAMIRNYLPPVLRENKDDWYIEFYAFDPAQNRMRRKKIKVNYVKGIGARRAYARGVMRRLSEHLAAGWNPWVASKANSDLRTFAEACDRYEAMVDKMYASGNYRKETYAGYKSNLKIMRLFNNSSKTPIYYAYQFDRKFCQAFLDYIFIERGAVAQTRNNYLNFLRVFSGWMLEHSYTPVKASDGISPISKRLIQKQRTVIPKEVVGQIADYLREHDPHFLLACYILYYCMIRPVEMTRLRISDISVKDSTITIPGDASKNHQTQTVTVPRKCLEYMVEIGIFKKPSSYHIFSVYNLHPGLREIDPRIFRGHWEKLRSALKLRREWKFYSLKDTGITEMLDNNQTSISVRDQARHSSLAITEIYTRHGRKANAELLDYDGAL